MCLISNYRRSDSVKSRSITEIRTSIPRKEFQPSHFVFKQITNLGAHRIGLIFLVVRLEDTKLFFVRYCEGDQGRQQCVLHAPL